MQKNSHLNTDTVTHHQSDAFSCSNACSASLFSVSDFLFPSVVFCIYIGYSRAPGPLDVLYLHCILKY